MRVDGNARSTLGYEPNGYGEWQEQPDFAKPPLELNGAKARRNHRAGDDYYSQPGKLFRLMSPGQQQVLLENIALAMGDVPKMIKIPRIWSCYKVDPAYGEWVAMVLGIPMREVGK
jgi:catalase